MTNIQTTNNTSSGGINREDYERDLKRRQEEHLKSVQDSQFGEWQPCMHDQCPECLGTGIRKSGGSCIHGISCPCPKHSFRC